MMSSAATNSSRKTGRSGTDVSQRRQGADDVVAAARAAEIALHAPGGEADLAWHAEAALDRAELGLILRGEFAAPGDAPGRHRLRVVGLQRLFKLGLAARRARHGRVRRQAWRFAASNVSRRTPAALGAGPQRLRGRRRRGFRREPVLRPQDSPGRRGRGAATARGAPRVQWLKDRSVAGVLLLGRSGLRGTKGSLRRTASGGGAALSVDQPAISAKIAAAAARGSGAWVIGRPITR